MSQQLKESTSFEIPLYSSNSKVFLVEEIALNENYNELHYGRCCVIGKIAVDPTDPTKSLIENIRLPSLPEEYSLPEGTVCLRLLTNSLRRRVPHGKICEIVGECILYDTIDPTCNRAPLTAKDVAERLNSLQAQNRPTGDYKDYLLSRYKPAISVDLVKLVDRGAELIQRNLEIRMLSGE